jgi:hypothetical protein
MSEQIYGCRICNKQVKVKKGKPVPICCKREMEPLPFCTLAPTAEMSRDDEPCDDGVKRKVR